MSITVAGKGKGKGKGKLTLRVQDFGLLSPEIIGVVGAAEYHWGTHAEATRNEENRKSSIFASVFAAAVAASTAVPALVFAPQQAYADVNASFIEAPLVGATPRPIPSVITTPQVDLTQQGWILEPQAARQGAVPQIIRGAPQDDPSQLQARLTPSQPAAAVAPNPTAQFFYVPSQFEERQTRIVWPALQAGSTPPVIGLTTGAPQHHNFARQDAAWTQVFPAAATPPAITVGPVPALVLAGQPQADTFQIPAVMWAPLEFGIAPPMPPPSVDVPSTPGRTSISGRTLDERLVRMLREHYRDRPDDRSTTLPAQKSIPAAVVADLSAYYAQSAKLAAVIAERRAEAIRLRERIARLEAEALAASKQREREALEHRMLLAQQRLILIAAEQEMLLAEIEAIDVAFFACIAAVVVLNS